MPRSSISRPGRGDYRPATAHLLKCAWEALESAGYVPSEYKGAIGVFAGSGMNTYLLFNLASNAQLLRSVGSLPLMVGNDKDYLATRVSYKLNLKGPSMNVQAACSTSLVAVSMACQSLLAYQCEMALAGGVSIRVPQNTGYRYQEGSIISPDGHCRTFDAKARGTIFGSGAGIVVLKRLEDALADGDVVQAVIRGSAVNNDGARKVGFTAPSVEGQAAVIAEALAMAEVPAETISYIEAHGTGTPIGDPIEITALNKVFATPNTVKKSCAIGSVKSNVGHLDTAAGVAGLIKAALALKHRQIPASLHYQQANPEIDFLNSPFYVNTELRQWHSNGMPRRAGVSSFGIGGTNAHLILEEAPRRPQQQEGKKWQLVAVSARSQEALVAARRRLSDHLEGAKERAGEAGRRVLHAGSREEGVHQACGGGVFQQAGGDSRAERGRRQEGEAGSSREGGREVIMMFSGQGAQYVGMGAGLYSSYKVYREVIDRCSQMSEGEIGVSIRGLLYGGEKGRQEAEKILEETEVTQAALFAVEYAGVKLLESLGVKAGAMIGHSLGEYVAACVAGVMSEEEAVRMVSVRGKLMQRQERGAMVGVMMSEEEMRGRLRGGVSISAVNGSKQVVIGGREEEIEGMREEMRREGIESVRLRTSHAFHSRMMEGARRELEEEVRKVRLREPKVRYISGVSGGWVREGEVTQAEYWGRQMVERVRWWEGAKEVLKIEGGVMLEVGPGEGLKRLMRREGGRGVVIESTMRGEGEEVEDEEKLMGAIGRMWVEGVKVEWGGMYEGERERESGAADLSIRATPVLDRAAEISF